MHQVHAEALEQFSRSIADIPECSVDVKGCMSLDAAIRLRGHDGREADRAGNVPDGEVARGDPVWRFRRSPSHGFPSGQGERGGRKTPSRKEIIRLQMADQHVVPGRILQVNIGNGVHIKYYFSPGQPAAPDQQLAPLDGDAAEMAVVQVAA